MKPTVLAVNPGSSSLKFALFELDIATGRPERHALLTGAVDRMGTPHAALRWTCSAGKTGETAVPGIGMADAWSAVQRSLVGAPLPIAIVCRVVHGGGRFTKPIRVTGAITSAIRGFADMAPVHIPPACDLLEQMLRRRPVLPVFAVFDTAFHAEMPDLAQAYGLPHELVEGRKIRRYGFHGIAHQFVSGRLMELVHPSQPGLRTVTCHLGSGASLSAELDGVSIDTTMGFSPLEGLMMERRSGDIDPGLVLYLLRTGMTSKRLYQLLNAESGMLGISGRSGDVRDLEASAASGDDRSRLALAVFAYRAAKALAGMVVALGGVDAIAFHGGIGQHSPEMRGRICGYLECLGIHLDERSNGGADGATESLISATGSKAEVWVVPADEEYAMTMQASALLANGPTATTARSRSAALAQASA
ncbi:MAG: acetate/propionate family kinase [Armatimonadetes bacterium]|nr:acetate/propionate family kinase [Armatimonadota bacterium]MDE2205246.1 acetate/propionate family kinase [Armatimonadota bacterium]